jgi:hypothetical protein
VVSAVVYEATYEATIVNVAYDDYEEVCEAHDEACDGM